MPSSSSKQQSSEQKGGQKTSQGHELVEPPSTGWEGPVPSSSGGSEPEYLLKPPYVWYSHEFKVSYTASCWCGALKLEYSGDPVDAKHCHCHQCQRLHGAPFQWAVLYHKTSVRLAKESDPLFLHFFSTQKRTGEHDVPCKISCRKCRSPMADEGRKMVMAYPSSFGFDEKIVPEKFKPTAHIFYSERVMDLDDGVDKWSGHKETSELMPHDTGEHGRIGLSSKKRRKGATQEEEGEGEEQERKK